MKVALLWLFIFTASVLSYSQQVTGVVIDNATSEPIPFAHIYSPISKIATVSNEQGAFTVNRVSGEAVDTLYISHISHDPKKVVFGDVDTELVIRLTKSTLVLEDVVIREDAADIALLAFSQLRESRIQFSKAFYRQITQVGNEPSEFIEVFYNSSVTRSGFDKIAVDQARFARKREGDFRFTNFSYLTFSFPVSKDTSRMVGLPFSDKFDEYTFRLNKRFVKGNDTYVQVMCQPPKNTNPEDSLDLFLSAEFTFNTTQNRLVEYRASIDHGLGADDFKVRNTEDEMEASNTHYEWHVAYSESEKSARYSIDYINVNYGFDLVINGESKPATVTSTTLIFEKDIKAPKRLKEPGIAQDDLFTAQKAKYKPRFWKDNPVIQLTPEQEKIIATFELENAFGSYFKK